MLFVVIGPGALAAITGVCAVYLVSGLAWAVPDTPLVIQLVSIGLVVFIAGVNLAGSSSSALLQRVLLCTIIPYGSYPCFLSCLRREVPDGGRRSSLRRHPPQCGDACSCRRHVDGKLVRWSQLGFRRVRHHEGSLRVQRYAGMSSCDCIRSNLAVALAGFQMLAPVGEWFNVSLLVWLTSFG